MKKILLLGGSAQQVIAIETAKKLGYYTVLCDYLEDNPGQFHADKFYLVSTTDKQKILEVAQKEKIGGVLAYASDPAAPTAAYVAEIMHLPGNPYQSVEILCNKDKFRNFLRENHFNTPKAHGYENIESALLDAKKFQYPVIVKPVDSSGSKGATVLQSSLDIVQALEFAFQFSRSHRVIVESFIEKKHPYLVGGDIFIIDGKIVLWGLLNCHRDSKVNPLVPVGKSYPLQLNKNDEIEIEKTLTLMIEKLGILNGAMNVELIVDKNNRVWPIDIGPRSGGNMIPDLLGDIFQIDIVKMSIRTAMGEKNNVKLNVTDGCYATHNLHSSKSGVYKKIVFSDEIEPYIYRKCLYKKNGDKIEFFDNASKCLGIIFLHFPEERTMFNVLDRIEDFIDVELM